MFYSITQLCNCTSPFFATYEHRTFCILPDIEIKTQANVKDVISNFKSESISGSQTFPNITSFGGRKFFMTPLPK